MSSKITDSRKKQIEEKQREIQRLTEELSRLNDFGQQLTRAAAVQLNSSSNAAKQKRSKLRDGLDIQEQIELNSQQMAEVTATREKLVQEWRLLDEF